MKYEIFIIIKKELAKFFGNKRMLFTTVLMPGLVVFVLYSIMGSVLNSQNQDKVMNDTNICIVNLPNTIKEILEDVEITYQEVDSNEEKQIKQEIEDNQSKILVIFPEKFDEVCVAFNETASIEIYYNSSNKGSLYAYSYISNLLEEYKNTLCNIFSINNEGNIYDMASERDSAGKELSAILPMLLIGLVFSCCLSIAAESIAGEKERGTIAALLVTPVRRNSVALGKLLSLTVIALLSGVSSYIGVILSMPCIINVEIGKFLFIYDLKDYIVLLITLISIILIVISLMLIVSTISNSVKEASTSLSPFVAGAMLIGMSCLIQNEPAKRVGLYLIPVYNSVQFIYSVLVHKVNYLHFAMMLCSNLIFTLIFVYVLARLFDNERVMFG